MTTKIPQKCLSCGFDLVNFGEIFALFLRAFIVNFKYSLLIVNAIKCYFMAYLVEHQIGVIFMRVVAKH